MRGGAFAALAIRIGVADRTGALLLREEDAAQLGSKMPCRLTPGERVDTCVANVQAGSAEGRAHEAPLVFRGSKTRILSFLGRRSPR